MSDPDKFHAVVLGWLRTRRPDASAVVSVRGETVTIRYVEDSWEGKPSLCSITVAGEGMESLWEHVVNSWPA